VWQGQGTWGKENWSVDVDLFSQNT